MQKRELTQEEIRSIEEDDVIDGPIECYSYDHIVRVFNEKKNGRFITPKILSEAHIKFFNKGTPNPIVMKNFMNRCLSRFLTAPITFDMDGLPIKVRNIRKHEIPLLAMPGQIMDRLGNPKIF